MENHGLPSREAWQSKLWFNQIMFSFRLPDEKSLCPSPHRLIPLLAIYL
jgi:hypothetical protein